MKPSPSHSSSLPLLLAALIGWSGCLKGEHLVGEAEPDAASTTMQPANTPDAMAPGVSPPDTAVVADQRLPASDTAVVPDPSPALEIPATEAARRLSKLIWGSEAAGAPRDALRTVADVGRAATTMLTDVRARDGVTAFYRWWLHLDAARALSSKNLGPAADETELFALQVTLFDDGRLPTLLQAPFSFVNASLASIYGVPSVSGQAFARTALDPTQRAGVFTQQSFLGFNAHDVDSNPVRRGVFVLGSLLCREVPPPPPGAVPPVTSDPTKTMRERVEASMVSPACKSCHSLIDPIGFAFEHYDGLGKFRNTENGRPVDASGSMNLDGATFIFNGAIQLTAGLAQSREVPSCFATQWFRFAMGRKETSYDTDSIAAARAAFTAAGLNIKSLIVAITMTRSFLAPGTP